MFHVHTFIGFPSRTLWITVTPHSPLTRTRHRITKHLASLCSLATVPYDLLQALNHQNPRHILTHRDTGDFRRLPDRDTQTRWGIQAFSYHAPFDNRCWYPPRASFCCLFLHSIINQHLSPSPILSPLIRRISSLSLRLSFPDLIVSLCVFPILTCPQKAK